MHLTCVELSDAARVFQQKKTLSKGTKKDRDCDRMYANLGIKIPQSSIRPNLGPSINVYVEA